MSDSVKAEPTAPAPAADTKPVEAKDTKPVADAKDTKPVADAKDTKPCSPVEQKILKQVEFYFGDSNLPTDKFLKGLTQKNDGWVLIETIASFKRMKQLSTDMAVIVGALRKSKTLLEINAEGTKLKRTTPLVEKDAKSREPFWIYAKGFAADANLDAIQAVFNKHTEGKVLCIRMRRLRGLEKTFKGSVFVEFDSEKEATRIAAQTITLDGKDEPLKIMLKADYVKMKAVEKEGRGGSAKGGKKRKAAGDADDTAKAAEGGEGGDKKETEGEAEERPIPLELLVKFKGLPDSCTREDLVACVRTAGAHIAYTDYSRGQPEGVVRLQETSPIKANEVVKKVTESKATLQNVVPEVSALEGEEETKYWTDLRSRQKACGGGRNKSRRKRQRK